MKNFTTFFTLLLIPLQFLLGQTNACLESQEFRIVILGSSTAAGTGVSTSDSAWVNRYRAYVQGINSNNEVINLAQGGFKTYNVMPTGFTPPANRPLPDTNRNITKALSLNPDAIIVNLPSNDNSSGYSVAEQLLNLDSLYAFSNQFNVPIWICTTQPVNYNSAAQRQIQEDLKDSIELKYGSFSINFWDTIALPDNSIDSIYNTDGTHVNDEAHAIFANRVIQKNILQYLYSTVTYSDFWAKSIQVNLPNLCGDTSTNFQVIVANIGAADSNTSTVYFTLQNMTLGTVFTDSINVSPSIPCQFDTFSFVSNTSMAGNYVVTGVIKNVNDTILGNDTAMLGFTTMGYPTIQVVDDTLCGSGFANLEIVHDLGDTLFWYQNYMDTNFIGTGSSFQTPYLTYSKSWYAEVIRGNLYYSNTILTSNSSSINWNGTMFDLVGAEDLTIDSFDVKIASLGTQIIEIYYKNGSYIGSELNASAWTFLGFKSVNVVSADDFTTVSLGNLNLTMGDTMGIYIQMANPSSNLSYSWISNPITRSNNELTILTGSGISHNYSNVYFPRDWSGKVYYHFGNRPNGECKTSREKVTAYVSKIEFDLRPDTIIDIASNIDYAGPLGMKSYLWFDGSTNQTLHIAANFLGLGIHHITLEVADSLNCKVTKETILGVADLVSIEEAEIARFKAYPNPTKGLITIEAEHVNEIKVYSLTGMEILSNSGSSTINIRALNPGTYVLKVWILGRQYVTKMVKE